jgi:hypothetical protein
MLLKVKYKSTKIYTMQTRSQTKYINSAIYEVNIDFDAASEAWKANKRSIGNGSYKYICCVIDKNGKKCGIKCISGEKYCRSHYKKLSIEN